MSKIDDKFNESLNFVVNNFRPEVFSDIRRKRDLQMITGIERKNPFLTRSRKIVAACIGVALVASASTLFILNLSDNHVQPTSPSITSEVMIETADKAVESAIIEFNDMPLTEVVKKIEEVYVIKISGLPEKDLRLTLRYEGNAKDLVETINEVLNINLSINE